LKAAGADGIVKTVKTKDNKPMSEVILTHVSKSFDKTDVLKDLTLTIHDQEFVVLVGPSGCGKSTALRIIAGLETLTEGEIKIGSKVVNDVPAKDRDIAMVFQNYALYPHMNVYDNMAFGLKMRKFSKVEIDKRVSEAAKILDLEHLLDRKPKQLSGGQRQRVALGRAIVRDPKVFLMDEPLSNLDAKLRVQMRSEITKLHQRLKATTVYVTHDQVEAMTMGQRIVILNKGIIQQVAEPMTIYSHPNNVFVAGFIGQMNFLTVTVQASNQTLVLSPEITFQLTPAQGEALKSLDGKEITLGLRPEHWVYDQTHNDSSNTLGPNTFEIKPDLIEALGSEKMIHFQLGGNSVIAKLPPEAPTWVGKPLNLTALMDCAHLFNKETELRIEVASPAKALV
jgi:multiple sugar transport system ATP-binding protein